MSVKFTSTHTPHNTHLVFIDPSVPDYAHLMAGVIPSTEVYLLHPQDDAIAQITHLLQGRTHIASLHLITHGSPNALHFSAGTLGLDNLQTYAEQLQTWKAALSPHANILLYGCNVAHGVRGKAFVTRLSQLTGTPVAASTTAIGSHQLGGNWHLEFHTGHIDASLAIAAETRASYAATLAISFGNTVNYATGGTFPRGLTFGDFDNDGDLDIFVSNETANNVSLMTNNGSGVFSAGTPFSAGGDAPHPPAVANFDGINGLDVAVPLFGSGQLGLLRSTGTGAFQPATTFTVGFLPVFAIAADFNNDGRPDAATANFGSSNVSVLLNNGSGGFNAATNVATGDQPYAIAVADFNSDGNLDMAVANRGSLSVSLLLGNGAGGFTAGTALTLTASPQGITVADFNDDGRPDLAIAATSTLSIRLNTGNGTFGSASNFNLGSNIFSVTSGDFNRDGRPDIAAVDRTSPTGTVVVLENDGSGNFGSPNPYTIGNSPSGVVAGDFNGDNRIDLVTSNASGDNISVVLNTLTTTVPTLDTSITPVLNQSTSATAPTGATGTLVSDLADLASITGGIDNVNDPDSIVTGIAIYAANQTSGTWWYSIDNGETWRELGTVSITNAKLLASNMSTRLYFQPNSGFSGTISEALSFHIWDRSTGTNGGTGNVTLTGPGTSFSTGSLTIPITANVPGANDSFTNAIILTGTVVATTGSNVNAAGENGEPAQSGTVNSSWWSWTAPFSGNFIIETTGSNFDTFLSIFTGTTFDNLVLVGQNDNHGEASTSRVILNAIAGSSYRIAVDGVNEVTGAIALNIRPETDPTPTIATNTLSLSEGGTVVLSNANLNATAPDIPPAQLIYTATEVTNGQFELVNAPGTAITSFTQAQIDAGAVQFVHDGSDTPPSYGLRVRNGDFSSATSTVAIAPGAFTPINDAPTLTAIAANPRFTEAPEAELQAAAVNLFSGANVSTIETGQTIIGLSFSVEGLVDGADERLVVDGTTITLDANTSGTTSTNSMGYTVNLAGGTATIALAHATGVSTAAINTLINGITYQNTNLDNPTAGNRIVTLTQIQDNGGTANGGNSITSLDLASTVTVSPVNDAPILRDTAVRLDMMRGNVGQPNGTVGVLVSELVQDQRQGEGRQNVIDPDTEAQLGIAIVGANTASGNWFYSTNSGRTWNPLGDLEPTNARLLAADENTRLYFQPNPGYRGTMTDALTFRAWDQTIGANGSLADASIGGGTSAFSSTTDTATLQVRSPGHVDFNNDGNVDIFWRNAVTGVNASWNLLGTSVTGASYKLHHSKDSGWDAVGTGDFTGDGKTDILWRNRFTGENGYWEMDGSTFVGSGLIDPVIPVSLGWDIVGTGDLTGDGKTDILWRNRISGESGYWEMDGTTFVTSGLIDPLIPVNSGWDIVGAGDFTNDGKTDIVWHNRITGDSGYWEMDNTRFVQGVAFERIPVESGWYLMGAGDFNQDGSADLFWQNYATGDTGFWLMQGATRTDAVSSLNIGGNSGWGAVL